MNTLNDSDFAALKAVRLAARAALKVAHVRGGDEHRYAILASAFLRGRKYRQHERSHPVTTNMDGSKYEHNRPSISRICGEVKSLLGAPALPRDPASALPLFRLDRLGIEVEIAAWLADPSGAKAVPPRAPKKPYVRPVAAAAAVAVAAE